MTIDKTSIKTSAVDAIWSTAIYFGFRKFYSSDIAFSIADAAVIIVVVGLIFIAGIVVD